MSDAVRLSCASADINGDLSTSPDVSGAAMCCQEMKSGQALHSRCADHSQYTHSSPSRAQVATQTKPDLIIFVMDGSIGQAAHDQAKAFRDTVEVCAVPLTPHTLVFDNSTYSGMRWKHVTRRLYMAGTRASASHWVLSTRG